MAEADVRRKLKPTLIDPPDARSSAGPGVDVSGNLLLSCEEGNRKADGG